MRARRYLVLVATVTMLIAVLAVPAGASSAGSFVSKINSSRAAAGLAPVESYWDLSDNARSHSNLMADRGELFHSSSLGSVTSGWEGLGENVGVGPDDVSAIHTAFMNSSAHRNNILGDFNYVGVGVTIDAEGFMWVTVIFMKAAPGLNGGGTTTTTTSAPTTTTTSAPPATTTTTQPPYTPPGPGSTTTTLPPQPPADEPQADDQSDAATQESEAADAYNDLVSRYPRFGSPSPPAIMD
jgi:uncharacterized protein YkwD